MVLTRDVLKLSNLLHRVPFRPPVLEHDRALFPIGKLLLAEQKTNDARPKGGSFEYQTGGG